MRARSLRGLVVAALAVLLLSTTGPLAATPQRPPKPQLHTVVIDASSFRPDFLVVNAGDTVIWINRDLFPHTATGANGAFDSKDIPAGKSWRFTPKVKGTFDYKCVYHTTMVGVIKVR